MELYNGAYRIPLSRYHQLMEREFLYSSAAGRGIKCDDYLSVAGKKKLCKQAGLSGAEKKACTQQIKSQCGNKPYVGPPFWGLANRKKILAWSKCAQAAVVPDTSITDAQSELDSLKAKEQESGMPTKYKVAIGVGALLLSAIIITVAVTAKPKAIQSAAPVQ